jgi:hypothetical protein
MNDPNVRPSPSVFRRSLFVENHTGTQIFLRREGNRHVVLPTRMPANATDEQVHSLLHSLKINTYHPLAMAGISKKLWQEFRGLGRAPMAVVKATGKVVLGPSPVIAKPAEEPKSALQLLQREMKLETLKKARAVRTVNAAAKAAARSAAIAEVMALQNLPATNAVGAVASDNDCDVETASTSSRECVSSDSDANEDV